MPRDLDLTFDISTGALTLDRVVGNYVKRSETLTLSVTIVSNGASATIPSGLVGTLKPVNTYGTTLAQWTTFSQVGATNVYTASTTINAAAVTTLLGTTTEQANCVFDFAGAGVVESDTLALVLKNNVTRDDDTAPTALLNRNDFLVSNGTGLLVNVAAGYAANGAFVAAQASLAITNATNYIEVTAAGVASVNTTAFTAGSYPLATVVASAGAITANTDLRAWITPKPATGGVTDGDKGDITVSNSGATWTIDNDAITLAKLAHMATARVVGRTTAGTGTPELLTISGTGSVAMTTSPTFATPNLDTPSVLVGTNITGTASGLTAGNATLAATVTVANEATDTTCFPLFATAATGSLAAMSNAGLTFNSSTGLLSATGLAGAFNGTVGATTPSTVAGTTGTFSGAVTVNANTYANNLLVVSNPAVPALGIDINPYNTEPQPTAGHPWMRVGGGVSECLMINAGLTGGYVDICPDLGSGLRVRDGTGGHVTYLTTPATGTLRVTTDGSTLGTVEAATGTFTTLTASATTSLLLGTAGSAVGNVGFRNATSGTTTLAPATGALGTGTVTLPLSGTLATLEGANTFTAANVNSTAGAASLPAMKFSGVPFAGTGTTSFPLVYINDANATASTTLNTAGTYFGVNGDGTQDLMNLLKDGTSQFKVSSTGVTTIVGQLNSTNGLVNSGNLTTYHLIASAANNSLIGWTGCFFGSDGTTIQVNNGGYGTYRDFRARDIAATGTLAVTGASTLTGNLTSNGALISTPQALSGAGAVNVTTLTTAVTTTAPAQALTLANGTNGQVKTIVHQALSGGGTWVLTPTTKTGYTTITSGAVGDTCTLQFFTTIGWCILSLRGAIAA
jgi:hypothetical protein